MILKLSRLSSRVQKNSIENVDIDKIVIICSTRQECSDVNASVELKAKR